MNKTLNRWLMSLYEDENRLLVVCGAIFSPLAKKVKTILLSITIGLLFVFNNSLSYANYGLAKFEELPELPLISTLPGYEISCVAIQGNYAYIGEMGRNRVHVADISDPQFPQIVATVEVRSPLQIIVKDNLAFVACRQYGLTIIDITAPTNPYILSRYDTIEYCSKVDVSDNILFATNRGAGLEMVDITNPSNPKFLNKIVLNGESQGIIIQREYAYVTQWAQRRIIVLDVSDPRVPVEVARVPLDGYGQGLDIRGNLLCAATGGYARNSQQPGSGSGMDIYDISNPSQPVHLATVKTPPFVGGPDVWSAIISGKYSFLTDGYHGVYVIDISDPVNPSVQAHASTQGFSTNLAVGKGYIYVCDRGSGLRIFRAEEYALLSPKRELIQLPITGPPPIELPPNFSIYKDKGSFRSVGIIRDMVIAAAGDAGLHLIQLIPELTKLNTIEPENFSFALDVSVWNENIFVAESNGLTIWRLDEFNRLVKKGSYYKDAFRIQTLTENRAILAVNNMRIHVLDTSDPANPEMISNVAFPNYIWQLCKNVFKQNNTCVVHGSGFTVLDLENSNAPVQYTYEQPCYGGAIYEDGSDTIGFFVGYKKLYIYDMNQESPTLISLIDLSKMNIEFYGSLTIENSMLILSSWDNGSFAIFDISNPLSPVLKTVYYTDFNCGPVIYYNGEYLIPNGRGGLLFISNNTPTASASPDQTVSTGSTITLDGSGSSDPDGDSLTYNWTLISQPKNSNTSISDSTNKKTSITPDADGTYRIQLEVSDGSGLSTDTMNIVSLGKDYKILIGTDKESYTFGDTINLYVWVGNPANGEEIKADAFIGLGLPDGSLYFFDRAMNLKGSNINDPKTFTPFARNSTFSPGLVFPGTQEMNTDLDSNGKLDSYKLYSVPSIPVIPEGQYFAFAVLAEVGSVKSGNPQIIGNPSLRFFKFTP